MEKPNFQQTSSNLRNSIFINIALTLEQKKYAQTYLPSLWYAREEAELESLRCVHDLAIQNQMWENTKVETVGACRDYNLSIVKNPFLGGFPAGEMDNL